MTSKRCEMHCLFGRVSCLQDICHLFHFVEKQKNVLKCQYLTVLFLLLLLIDLVFNILNPYPISFFSFVLSFFFFFFYIHYNIDNSFFPNWQTINVYLQKTRLVNFIFIQKIIFSVRAMSLKLTLLTFAFYC